MVQNHMMQLLSLSAMEPPVALRRRRACATRRSRCCARSGPLHPEDVAEIAVRGQYGPGDRRRPADPRLPRGAGRRARLARPRRYVALKLFDRQLALGGRAVLSAHGQAAAEARDGDRHPVQARRRTCCSSSGRRDSMRAERARHAHPAGRGHLAQVRLEGAGPDDADRCR